MLLASEYLIASYPQFKANFHNNLVQLCTKAITIAITIVVTLVITFAIAIAINIQMTIVITIVIRDVIWGVRGHFPPDFFTRNFFRK